MKSSSSDLELILLWFISKTIRLSLNWKNWKNVQHVKICKKVPQLKMSDNCCRVCRSWHAEHACSLNLTFISYSLWNKGQKALTFWKFDEKRAITPKWVIQHVKIYIPCNFEINLIAHLGVIALFSSNFLNFNTFHLIFQKL
jgi:hypothetical protein